MKKSDSNKKVFSKKPYAARPSRQINYIQRALHPKYVPFPYQYRDQEMRGYGPRVVPFSVRLAMYLDENHLSAYRFAQICDEIGSRLGIKMQGSDIINYISGICAPKKEKLAVICEAMGVSEHYATGYTHYSHKCFSATTKPNFRDGKKAA